MKGIVVDINNKDSIIMTEDGLFLKIKNNNYEVGQTVTVKKNSSKASKLIAGAASMVAAIALCTVGGYAYFTPTDYISMDVNPSIEYSVNTFDRILDAKAVNDDGQDILSSLDLNNMSIEDGLKETLDELITEGFISDDPNGGVIITTSNDEMDKAEELAAQLKQEIQSYLDDQDGIAAEVDAEAVGLKRVQEARELGVTPGKLNLVEKLQSTTDSAINMEEWLTKPVKEINKAIKENRELEKNQIKNQKIKMKEEIKQQQEKPADKNQKSENKKIEKKEQSALPASAADSKKPDKEEPIINVDKKPENEQSLKKESEMINNQNNQGNDKKEQEPEKAKGGNEGSNGDPSGRPENGKQGSDSAKNQNGNQNGNHSSGGSDDKNDE